MVPWLLGDKMMSLDKSTVSLW